VGNDQVFSEREWQQVVLDFTLPPRQAQVVECILQGLSDKQIAERLNIAVPTIRTYLARLFRRFRVQDRVELVLHIVAHFRQKCRAAQCPCQ
jgi:DNA-binding NarL/FixJ family response regulator